jgi:hypothetical protein
MSDVSSGYSWWSGSDGEWKKKGNAIYNNPANSYVGIGTTAPTTALHVVGTIKGDRVLGVDWPDITNKIEPVQSDWKEENTQLQAYIKNRPEYLTQDDINMVYSILGALLAAYLAALGISAFTGGLAGLLKRLFGGPDDGEDGEDGEDANVFDDKIIDLIRKTLNPNIATCVTSESYAVTKVATYLDTSPIVQRDQPKLYVNWTDNLYGNPIASPCSTNSIGILRDVMMSASAKMYVVPQTRFTVDPHSKITTMASGESGDTFIDFGTRAVSLLTIPTTFTAPQTAKIGVVDAYDFELDKSGVSLRWPSLTEREAYDQELRYEKYDIKRVRNSIPCVAAAVLAVRRTASDSAQTSTFIPVIDYKGQYLQNIHPSQILTTEALNIQSLNDGNVRLHRDLVMNNNPLFGPQGDAPLPEPVALNAHITALEQTLAPVLDTWTRELYPEVGLPRPDPLAMTGTPLAAMRPEPLRARVTSTTRYSDPELFARETQKYKEMMEQRRVLKAASTVPFEENSLTAPIQVRYLPRRPPPPLPPRAPEINPEEAILNRFDGVFTELG